MKHLALLSAATSLVAGLGAQSNTVPGLDGRLTEINNLTYWGRHGATHPNGEVGMSMLNEMCNPGSVNIPWYAPMQPNHPMFGFIIARVSNDRIEQINEWSYCKHAFLSVNVNGPCGSCQNPGTGSLMGLNCADTYSQWNNASRTYLGPPQEIDPWLGEWDPVGSYFDIGDPAQAGYPAAADGSRSLNTNIFDDVDNRVTVDEVDLLTANADYYYGIQLLHRGEAVVNRHDNIAHRGFTPSWNGTSWSFNNNSEAQAYGSILNRWPGATVHEGGNGNDDGRFFVASKVTGLGGGNYHFEYAVHNVDNSRAGGSFRVPIDASATAGNFSFGDIDTDAANDWTVQRVGNEIVFTAPANNPLEWNTIYNFGFDADFPPGASTIEIDEARVGPGATFVSVQAEVPGGATIATFETFGFGCDGSTEIPQPNCAERNPLGGVLSNTLTSNDMVHLVSSAGSHQIESIDLFTASVSGSPVSVEAYVYLQAGSLPAATPFATTTMTVDGAPGFYRATFSPPVAVAGNYYIGLDTAAQTAYVPELTAGATFVSYQRAGAGTWTVAVNQPSYIVNCVQPTIYEVPSLSAAGLPSLGASYDVQLADALPSAVGLMIVGFSDSSAGGVPLPAALPGTPACTLYASLDVLEAVLTAPDGSATFTVNMGTSPSFVGAKLFHQWAILDSAANQLGIVTSDAGVATVGN